MRRALRTLGFLLWSAAWAVARDQSVLRPVGPQAAKISHLWWAMLLVTTITFVLVIAFLSRAVASKKSDEATLLEPPLPMSPESESGLTRGVTIAVGLSVMALFGLLVVSIMTERSVASLASKNAVTIEVTGRQWWWQVRYDDPVPSQTVVTANEIHIPVGEPVVILTSSSDVIHSFWVPNIHGKRDLIPGYTNALWIQADQPGTYRGQCAEFCGHQHAHMAFYVIAEPKDRYLAWLDAQRKPAADPDSDLKKRGRELFTSATCNMCHTIRGTQSGAVTAPDLTHLASRNTIASGTLHLDHENLKKWISDSQSVKPGTRMPAHQFSDQDMDALLAYLESLR